MRLSSGVRPTQVQAILDNGVTTPTRSKATVLLEELDGDELVVRVQATPERAHDGAALADEIIAALSSVTGEHEAVDPDKLDGARDRGTSSDDLSSAPTVRAHAVSTPERESEGDGAGGPSDPPSIHRGPARVRK